MPNDGTMNAPKSKKSTQRNTRQRAVPADKSVSVSPSQIKLNPAMARRAIVMAEIIGAPVSKRQGRRLP